MEFCRLKKYEDTPAWPATANKRAVPEAPRIPYPKRSLYSPLLLAERFSENDVVQRKPGNTEHVEFFDETKYAAPVPNYHLHKPIMVYETFGPDKRQMENIYAQTQGYDGETIVVLGVNSVLDERNPPKYPITTQNGAVAALGQNTPVIDAVPHHDAQVQPFIWTPTTSTSGYDLPYFEVRGSLMTEAKKLSDDKVEEIKNNTKAEMEIAREALGRANMDYIDAKRRAREDNRINLDDRLIVIQQHQNHFDLLIDQIKYLDNLRVLYRWIDRDATNDNSNDINPKGLNKMALHYEPMILSGAYNWNYGEELQHLAPFINRLNECEILLRETWHQLNNTVNANEGFYLPEPALIMNELAHDTISKSMLTSSQERQDRESEFAHQSLDTRRKIMFYQGFQVDKPVKDAGKPSSYLKQLEELWAGCKALVDQKKSNRQKFLEWKNIESSIKNDFINMLKNTRQSVFNNGQWYFDKSKSAWENETANITSLDGAITFQNSDNSIAIAQQALNGYRKSLAINLYTIFIDTIPHPPEEQTK